VNEELRDVLPLLEPPPGGLERLRRRLDADARARARWRAGAVGVALAASVVIGVLWPRHVESSFVASDFVLIAARGGLLGDVVTSVEPGRLAVERVPIEGDAVVYYRLDGVSRGR
jgi:hypothetical protein